MKSLLSALFLSVLVASCSTTGYQPREGNSSGYSDMSLGNDMYKVSYQGNSVTESETVYNYFLRRCAELAVEKDFDYFAFIDQSDSSKTNVSTFNSIYPQDPYAYRRGRGYTYPYGPQVFSTTEHSRHGVIKLFKKGSQPPTAIEAKEVLKNFAQPTQSSQ